MQEKKCAVAVGDPFDGVVLYGPFDSTEEANEWADHHRHCRNDTWWVVSMYPPETK